MLVNVEGPVGSGKTLLTTYFALRSKNTVYANYKINIPNYRPYKLAKLFDIIEEEKTPKLIILDEAYSDIESRLSGTRKINMILSYLLNQRRKRSITIMLTEQDFTSIDKRFRKQVDIYITCEKVSDGFKYHIIPVTFGKRIKVKKMSMYLARKIFPYYDTNEIVLPQNFSGLKWDLYLLDYDLYNEKITELANKIKPELEDGLTHNKLSDVLLRNGIKLKGVIQNDLYNRLKAVV